MGYLAGLVGPDPARRERARSLAAAWGGKVAEGRDSHAVFSGSGASAHAENGERLVVFDGHVYNRDELGSPCASDAELFARLAAERGVEKAAAAVNGDFAAAIHDGTTGELALVRDRLGVRPLYYAAGDGPVFASTPLRLARLLGAPLRPRPAFVARYLGLHYRYIDDEIAESPYHGIHRVPPACVVRVTADGARVASYWSLAEAPERSESEDELREELRALLLDAVARRLRAAPRPVFTLSGGMDSSSVLACAVASSGQRLPAISTVYDDATYDESDDIATALPALVSKWHPVPVGGSDVFALVEELLQEHEEPVPTATWLSHAVLCREARDLGFESLFGGLGGDELNAGEYEYFPFFFADLRARGDRARLEREIEAWARLHDHPIFRKSRSIAGDLMAALTDESAPGRCRPVRERMFRYARAVNPDYFPLEAFDPDMPHAFESHLRNRALQDLTRETLPCCLRAEHRGCEAAGMTHFLPFLDHRLVELMFGVDGTLKIRDGVTKHLLRQAMSGLLPESTRTRVKKTGWNAPAHRWFVGPGRERLLDIVHSRAFRERGVYDVGVVERLVDEHEEIVLSGRAEENHMMFLWQLLNTELWLRWLDRQPWEWS